MTANELIAKLQSLSEDERNLPIHIYKYDYTDIPVECTLDEEDISIVDFSWNSHIGIGC